MTFMPVNSVLQITLFRMMDQHVSQQYAKMLNTSTQKPRRARIARKRVQHVQVQMYVLLVKMAYNLESLFA